MKIFTAFALAATFAAAPTFTNAQIAASAALDTCLEIAGNPNSGVPANPGMLKASLDALTEVQASCQTAIDGGAANSTALFHLGVSAQHAGDHAAALERFQEAADFGLAAAETKLGDYQLFGIGPVDADADKALEYYTKATDLGDLGGMTTLAFMYRLGRGVQRDTGEMVRLMQLAADGGYHFAQYRLAQTYLTGDGIPGGSDTSLGIPDVAKAAELLEAAANQGNARAALDLAQLYADDANGIPADMPAHANWITKAAETDMPVALNALGFLYEKGRGLPVNPDRAAELYIQALESGQVKFADLRGRVNGRAVRWDRATAVAFQLILRERGLYRGAIDGDIGPQTRRAAAALDD